jgi:transcriptional regulator GlxA family with amidase domain
MEQVACLPQFFARLLQIARIELHPELEWIEQAKAALSKDLESTVDIPQIALDLGLGYENFRKRFQRETGLSPARYRSEQRIEAAKQIFRFSPQATNDQIAGQLGFSDGFHFSKRFKELTGLTPGEYKRSFSPPQG